MQLLSGGGLRRLRPDDHVRVVRLADVARAALVLDDLRRADHGRPGAVGARVPDRRARLAQPPRRRSTASSSPAHFHDLGNLMLAFVMLWAYFSFSQYLIIWSGNLPEEIALVPAPAADRLARRSALALIVVSLRRAVRAAAVARGQARAASCCVKVAVGILVVRLVDLFWLIAPEFHQRRHRRSAGSTSCCRSRSARIWLGCFVWQLRGRAILPVHDPQFDEALGRIIERGATAEDGALSHGRRRTRTRDTRPARPSRRRATSTSAAIFGFGARPARRRRRRSTVIVWLLFVYFDGARSAAARRRVSAGRGAGAPRAARAAAADQPARGSRATCARRRTTVLDELRLGRPERRHRADPDRRGDEADARARAAGATGSRAADERRTTKPRSTQRRRAVLCS